MPNVHELVTIIQTAEITLPALEMFALISLLTACILFHFSKTGLLIAYLFCYRWGWMVLQGQRTEVIIPYLVFGCAVGLLYTISALWQKT